MRQVQRLPLVPTINLYYQFDLYCAFLHLSDWCLMASLKAYYWGCLQEQKLSFFIDYHRYAFSPAL